MAKTVKKEETSRVSEGSESESNNLDKWLRSYDSKATVDVQEILGTNKVEVKTNNFTFTFRRQVREKQELTQEEIGRPKNEHVGHEEQEIETREQRHRETEQ